MYQYKCDATKYYHNSIINLMCNESIARRRGILPWLWNPGQTSHAEVWNRSVSGPTETRVLQNVSRKTKGLAREAIVGIAS